MSASSKIDTDRGYSSFYEETSTSSEGASSSIITLPKIQDSIKQLGSRLTVVCSTPKASWRKKHNFCLVLCLENAQDIFRAAYLKGSTVNCKAALVAAMAQTRLFAQEHPNKKAQAVKIHNLLVAAANRMDLVIPSTLAFSPAWHGDAISEAYSRLRTDQAKDCPGGASEVTVSDFTRRWCSDWLKRGQFLLRPSSSILNNGEESQNRYHLVMHCWPEDAAAPKAPILFKWNRATHKFSHNRKYYGSLSAVLKAMGAEGLSPATKPSQKEVSDYLDVHYGQADDSSDEELNALIASLSRPAADNRYTTFNS